MTFKPCQEKLRLLHFSPAQAVSEPDNDSPATTIDDGLEGGSEGLYQGARKTLAATLPQVFEHRHLP